MPRQLHGRAARRVLLRPQKARVQGLPGARAYLLPAPAAVGRSTAPKGPMKHTETGCPHPLVDSEPRVQVGVGGHAGPCTPGGPPPAGCVRFTVIRRSPPGPSPPQRQWARAEAASGGHGAATRATGAGTCTAGASKSRPADASCPRAGASLPVPRPGLRPREPPGRPGTAGPESLPVTARRPG